MCFWFGGIVVEGDGGGNLEEEEEEEEGERERWGEVCVPAERLKKRDPSADVTESESVSVAPSPSSFFPSSCSSE